MYGVPRQSLKILLICAAVDFNMRILVVVDAVIIGICQEIGGQPRSFFGGINYP